MKHLFVAFLLLITGTNANAAEPPVCYHKSYNYSGPYYSDAYKMPERNELQSCHDRKTVDASQLGELHKVNRDLISAQIDKMLAMPVCKDVHDELNLYREKLSKQKDKTVKAFKVVTEWFDSIKERFDIQRQWAYSAAYNNACGSERNNESTFIDLDTINKVLAPAGSQANKVTADNKDISDCADVTASGSEDVKDFKVSMKKAKGDSFQLQFDPYSIPDQIIIKSDNGSVLYDSGCKGYDAEADINVKVPLSNLSNEKNVIFSVNNNCADPKKEKGVSVWDLNIKCEQERTEDLCAKPKQELTDLLVQEINYYKKFMDANILERHCLRHFDDTILKEMEHYGLFIIEGGVKTNGLCATLDELCLSEQMKDPTDVNINSSASGVQLDQTRNPSTIQIQEYCPGKPDEKESIFKLISWNYCMNKEKIKID